MEGRGSVSDWRGADSHTSRRKRWEQENSSAREDYSVKRRKTQYSRSPCSASPAEKRTSTVDEDDATVLEAWNVYRRSNRRSPDPPKKLRNEFGSASDGTLRERGIRSVVDFQ